MPDAMLLIGDEAAHGESAYHMDNMPLNQHGVYEMDSYNKSFVTQASAGPSSVHY